MEDKKRATQAILPRAVGRRGKKKHGFGRNVYISVGSGKAMVGLWVSRDVFFEGTDALREEKKKGGLVADRTEGSGSSARPLPGKGAPSPACGSVLVRRQGTVSRFRVLVVFWGGGFFLVTFDTCHIQNGGLRHRRARIKSCPG